MGRCRHQVRRPNTRFRGRTLFTLILGLVDFVLEYEEAGIQRYVNARIAQREVGRRTARINDLPLPQRQRRIGKHDRDRTFVRIVAIGEGDRQNPGLAIDTGDLGILHQVDFVRHQDADRRIVNRPATDLVQLPVVEN